MINAEFYEILFEQEYANIESLTERAVIINNRYNFSVHSTPDSKHFLGEPAGYFKWVEDKNLDVKNKDIVRIKFDSPTYIRHNNSKKVLSKDQKRELMRVLQSPISNKHYNNLPDEFKNIISTEWQYLIYMYNLDCHVDTRLLLHHTSLEEPFSSLPDKKIVRLTIPIPDYTKLKEEEKK